MDELAALAALGCAVVVGAEIDRFRLTATARSSGNFVVEATGDWSDVALDDDSARAGAQAAALNDLAGVLASLQPSARTVAITVIGDNDPYPWLRTSRAFRAEFERSGWFGLAGLLRSESTDAVRLLVLDAVSAVVEAPGLVVHGPDVWPTTSALDDPSQAYTAQRTDTRPPAPTPHALAPLRSEGDLLSDVVGALWTVAGSLAWFWLVDSAVVDGNVVTARIDGARSIAGALETCPTENAAASVAVWRWVVDGDQPGRRQALVQAVTLQANTPNDLYARAASALDTAEFLFSVAQSGLIQEALSARRSARDAAVTAGRAAGDRARATARSAVDRTLVVIGGGIGVLLANKGELINAPIALGLLGLATALTVAAALSAFHFELPAATRAVAMFREELPLHEVLSQRDIDSITNLPSLVDGLAETKRARRVTAWIVGMAVGALLILVAITLLDWSNEDGESSSTTTTTTVATTTTTTTVATTTTTIPPPTTTTTTTTSGVPTTAVGSTTSTP